jgi:hypothetical protein
MSNLSKSTKIFIAITVVILLVAIVFILVKKNKESQTAEPANTSSATSGQTTPVLPQGDQPDTASFGTSSQNPSATQPTSQNSASSGITPPIQEPPISESFSIEKRTDYSYDAVKANPAIENSIRNAKNDFKLDDIGVSLPVATTKTKNGDEITLLSGCTPHDCGGTNIVIAYDNTNGKAYILAERVGTAVGYQIYGSPPEEIKNLLVYYFLHN